MISRVAVFLGALLLVGASLFAQQRGAAPAAAPAGARAVVAPMPQGNLEHGRYLVENVAMCYECHSARDERGNLIASTRFLGGSMPFRPPWPASWPETIPRIAGLPGYTDELAMRLLTQGAIKRDGTQLRKPMPAFRMSPQDAADVIAYIRSK